MKQRPEPFCFPPVLNMGATHSTEAASSISSSNLVTAPGTDKPQECPVQHKPVSASSAGKDDCGCPKSAPSQTSPISECPVAHGGGDATMAFASECPAAAGQGDTQDIDPRNMVIKLMSFVMTSNLLSYLY